MVTLQQSGLFAGLQVMRAAKQNVQRRDVVGLANVQQGGQQGLAGGVRFGQQAAARHGGEGRGDQGFGVIVEAVALVGVGPGVVKHVFAA